MSINLDPIFAGTEYNVLKVNVVLWKFWDTGHGDPPMLSMVCAYL